jgi:hypothetical protein
MVHAHKDLRKIKFQCITTLQFFITFGDGEREKKTPKQGFGCNNQIRLKMTLVKTISLPIQGFSNFEVKSKKNCQPFGIQLTLL